MIRNLVVFTALLSTSTAYAVDPASLKPDRVFNFCLASGMLYSTAAAESLGMNGILASAQDAVDKLDINRAQLDSILAMYREDPAQAQNDSQLALADGGDRALMQFASLCTRNPSKYVPNYSSLKKSGRILD